MRLLTGWGCECDAALLIVMIGSASLHSRGGFHSSSWVRTQVVTGWTTESQVPSRSRSEEPWEPAEPFLPYKRNVRLFIWPQLHLYHHQHHVTLMGARKRSRMLTANTKVSGYSCNFPWSSVNQRTASSRWAGEMSVSCKATTRATFQPHYWDVSLSSQQNRPRRRSVIDVLQVGFSIRHCKFYHNHIWTKAGRLWTFFAVSIYKRTMCATSIRSSKSRARHGELLFSVCSICTISGKFSV